MSTTAEHKSFLIYKDAYPAVIDMTNEEAGRIFKAVFLFAVEGKNTDFSDDRFLKHVFATMTDNIRRDDEKYQEICSQNSAKGKRKKQLLTTDNKSKQLLTAETDKDNDIETDIECDIECDIVKDSGRDTELLSAAERAELEKLADGLSVASYITKLKSWQAKTGKAIRSPFETIQKWITEDTKRTKASKPKSSNISSYDIAEWERYAMTDPNTRAPHQ